MRARAAFLHMPKVAGMSLIAAVHEALRADGGARKVCPTAFDRSLFGGFPSLDRIAPHLAAQLLPDEPLDAAAIDVMMGHFALSTLRRAFAAADVAVLLREPRARLLSQYTYWRSWDDATHDAWQPFDNARRAADEPWETFLLDGSLAAQIDNLMLRLLLWPDPRLPDTAFIDEAAIDGLVDEALAHLEALGHVDVIERGPATWEAFAAWLGAPLDVQRVNETAPSSAPPLDWAAQLTPRAQQALHARTRGDRALWDAAVRRRPGSHDVATWADAVWSAQVARVSAAEVSAALAVARAEACAALATARAEVDAWERSRTARLTRPLRRAAARRRPRP